MKKNMGQTDRIVRLLLAILFAILYFTGVVSGTWGVILLILAIVLIVTAYFKFCPLYALFKLNTLKK